MKPFYQDLPFESKKINLFIEDLPYFTVPWHYHTDIEIMYVEQSRGLRFVGDSVESYEEGDICIIGANLPHEWRNDSVYFRKENELNARCYCIFFQKNVFDNYLIQLPEMSNIRELLERTKRGIKFSGNNKNIIQNMIVDVFNCEGINRLVKFLSLLDYLALNSNYEYLASVNFSTIIESVDFDRFNKVYQYMIKNYMNQIRLEEIASIAGLSSTAFCRYFKKRTKRTFVEFLNEIRIGRAKRLLIEDKMKISTIALEVGFSSLSNFIDQFKKHSKMLPIEFLKLHRNTT